MRILGSIVAPSTTLMSSCDSKITGSGSIRPQIVRDQLVWDKSILLQQLAHEFQRGTLVPPALDQHIKHFALGIHGAPKIDHAAGDFQIDLIQMPGRVGLGSTSSFGNILPTKTPGARKMNMRACASFDPY